MTAVTGHLPVLDGEPDAAGDAGVQAVSEGYGSVDLAAVLEVVTGQRVAPVLDGGGARIDQFGPH